MPSVEYIQYVHNTGMGPETLRVRRILPNLPVMQLVTFTHSLLHSKLARARRMHTAIDTISIRCQLKLWAPLFHEPHATSVA